MKKLIVASTSTVHGSGYLAYLLPTLADFFNERGIDISTEDFENTSLIGSGLLDSFELLTLLINLEVELNIKISPEEIYKDETVSVASFIAKLHANLS